MSTTARNPTKRSQFSDWKQKARIFENAAGQDPTKPTKPAQNFRDAAGEPTKPSKPSFVGFAGTTPVSIANSHAANRHTPGRVNASYHHGMIKVIVSSGWG